MILIVCPFGGVVVPPVSERVTEETPLTTVIARVVVVDVSKLAESVGVKVAVSETDPSAPGVQEHVALVDAAAADPQPEMVEPPSIKFTAPARGTIAVIVTAPPRAAVDEEFGSDIEIDVDALLTVMVNVFDPT
jgi:hypothetical protein